MTQQTNKKQKTCARIFYMLLSHFFSKPKYFPSFQVPSWTQFFRPDNPRPPIDPTYQYKDSQGRTVTRRFAPILQHERHMDENASLKFKAVYSTKLYVFLAVAAILFIAVVAATIIAALGRVFLPVNFSFFFFCFVLFLFVCLLVFFFF